MDWLPTETVEEALPTCTVCRRTLDGRDPDDGFFYIPDPDFMTNEDWDQIAEIWQVNPHDLTVCEHCMGGHCGAVPHLTPDGWLAKHWEAYLKRRKAAE